MLFADRMTMVNCPWPTMVQRRYSADELAAHLAFARIGRCIVFRSGPGWGQELDREVPQHRLWPAGPPATVLPAKALKSLLAPERRS